MFAYPDTESSEQIFCFERKSSEKIHRKWVPTHRDLPFQKALEFIVRGLNQNFLANYEKEIHMKQTLKDSMDF